MVLDKVWPAMPVTEQCSGQADRPLARGEQRESRLLVELSTPGRNSPAVTMRTLTRWSGRRSPSAETDSTPGRGCSHIPAGQSQARGCGFFSIPLAASSGTGTGRRKLRPVWPCSSVSYEHPLSHAMFSTFYLQRCPCRPAIPDRPSVAVLARSRLMRLDARLRPVSAIISTRTTPGDDTGPEP